MKEEIFLYDVRLSPNRKLSAFAATTPLNIVASFSVWVEAESEIKVKRFVDFVVVKGAGQCILGRNTSKAMGLMQLGGRINALETEEDVSSESEDMFPIIPNEVVEFVIDPAVPPSRNAFYNVPAPFRERARERIDKMEKQGIIEKVTKAPKWISGMFAVPKGPNDFRLVLNMRGPNKAIMKAYHRLPHLEEIQRSLTGARWFSKFDMPSAFHHALLGEASRELTTFLTDHGMYRFCRLLFGVNSAPEAFQQIMERILDGLDGVIVYIDDMLCYADTLEALIERETAVWERLKANNISPNLEKCEFRKQRLTFLGHEISEAGMNIEDSKVKAIRAMRAPSSVTELRSFLGFANYVGSYIKNFADITHPLWELTKKDSFQWSEAAQRAFENVKKAITECTLTKGFYSDTDETILYCDASPVAVGAVLTQVDAKGDHRTICCTSKTLTPTQRRYPQVHREAFAIVQGVEDNHFFLQGRPFKILTDARPVAYIFKHEADWSKRVLSRAQGFALRLSEFDFDIEYIEGDKSIADPASRLCGGVENELSKDRSPWEIAAITGEAEELAVGERSLTFINLAEETAKDRTLQKVISALECDDWETNIEIWAEKTVSKFKRFFDELYMQDGMLVRSGRVVVPESLRKEALLIAHSGHPGGSAMKSILRSRVWWPAMDSDVEKHVLECKGCALITASSRPVPMTRTIMPAAAWDYIALDFNGPYAQHRGVYVVVICDYFSRYMIAVITQSIAFEAVKKILESVFEKYGRPIGVKIDNGPPFNGIQFREFCVSGNIEPIFTTPYHPQQNGMVERGMQVVNKAMKIAKIDGVEIADALRQRLRAYNTAAHRVTGVAPEELLYNRKIRRGLPLLGSANLDFDIDEVRTRDSSEKRRGKEREDMKRSAKQTLLQVGDKVVVKRIMQPKKGDAWFREPSWKIVEDLGHGDFRIKDKDGVVARRNVIHLKKVTWQEEDSSEHTAPMVQSSPQHGRAASPEAVAVRVSSRVRAEPTYLSDFVREIM